MSALVTPAWVIRETAEMWGRHVRAVAFARWDPRWRHVMVTRGLW